MDFLVKSFYSQLNTELIFMTQKVAIKKMGDITVIPSFIHLRLRSLGRIRTENMRKTARTEPIVIGYCIKIKTYIYKVHPQKSLIRGTVPV